MSRNGSVGLFFTSKMHFEECVEYVVDDAPSGDIPSPEAMEIRVAAIAAWSAGQLWNLPAEVGQSKLLGQRQRVKSTQVHVAGNFAVDQISSE